MVFLYHIRLLWLGPYDYRFVPGGWLVGGIIIVMGNLVQMLCKLRILQTFKSIATLQHTCENESISNAIFVAAGIFFDHFW